MAYRLLLVEDQEDLRDALVLQIKQDNPKVEIQTAGSLAEALKRLSVWQVNLCILDLGLPDGGGFTVLDAIRKGTGRTAQDAPVLIYSALDPESIASVAERRGASAYLPKSPLGLEKLRHWVTDTLFELKKSDLRSGVSRRKSVGADPRRKGRTF